MGESATLFCSVLFEMCLLLISLNLFCCRSQQAVLLWQLTKLTLLCHFTVWNPACLSLLGFSLTWPLPSKLTSSWRREDRHSCCNTVWSWWKNRLLIEQPRSTPAAMWWPYHNKEQQPLLVRGSQVTYENNKVHRWRDGGGRTVHKNVGLSPRTPLLLVNVKPKVSGD